LHYVEGLSQREIAALLGLPVSTVNNRMHTGRSVLRREFQHAATAALRRSRLPSRFADRMGAILRIRGPVVDVQFDVANLPHVLETIALRDEARRCDAILEVVQRRGHGVVRCLATSPESFVPGTRTKRAEALVGAGSIRDSRAAIAALSEGRGRHSRFQETGIKAIDLLCPLVVGGTVAIAGDPRAGKLVLVQELARRLAQLSGGIGVFSFVGLAERPWARQVSAAMEVQTAAPDLAFFLGTDGRDEPVTPDDVPVDAFIHISRALAERRIYPAIDPLRSWSRYLTPDVVGRGHCVTAQSARGILDQLASTPPAGDSAGPEDSRLPTARAWKLQLYLSQPFFVAEPFTKLEGAWVTKRETISMCREILDGKHDHTPPLAFHFAGAKPRAIGTSDE